MSQGNWKRFVLTLSSAAWTVVVVNVAGGLPKGYENSLGRLALGIAVVTTFRMMLWSHARPLGQAYEIGHEEGYEKGRADGRREWMREASARNPVSPIRRVSRGLSEFNRATL